MGFGYLLCGYLVSLNPVYSGFTEWLGYALMLFGVTRLSVYNRGYRIAQYIGFFGLFTSFAQLVFSCLDMLGLYSYQGTTLYSVISMLSLILCVLFRCAVFYGTYQIARETGIDRLAVRAVYCIVIHVTVFIFNFLMTVKLIPPSSSGFMIVLFAGLLVGLVAFSLFFSCYRSIGLEGEELEIQKAEEKEKRMEEKKEDKK